MKVVKYYCDMCECEVEEENELYKIPFVKFNWDLYPSKEDLTQKIEELYAYIDSQ